MYFIEHKISKCYHFNTIYQYKIKNPYQYKVNNEIVTFVFFIVPSKYGAYFCSHSTAKIGLGKCSLGLCGDGSWWPAQLKIEGAASTESGELPSLQGPRRRSFLSKRQPEPGHVWGRFHWLGDISGATQPPSEKGSGQRWWDYWQCEDGQRCAQSETKRGAWDDWLPDAVGALLTNETRYRRRDYWLHHHDGGGERPALRSCCNPAR